MSILTQLKDGQGYDKEDAEVRRMIEKMYRQGMLTMNMATGELRLSSYGQEILEGLQNVKG